MGIGRQPLGGYTASVEYSYNTMLPQTLHRDSTPAHSICLNRCHIWHSTHTRHKDISLIGTQRKRISAWLYLMVCNEKGLQNIHSSQLPWQSRPPAFFLSEIWYSECPYQVLSQLNKLFCIYSLGEMADILIQVTYASTTSKTIHNCKKFNKI